MINDREIVKLVEELERDTFRWSMYVTTVIGNQCAATDRMLEDILAKFHRLEILYTKNK